MVVIVIRHGKDDKKSHRHDARLGEGSKKQAGKRALDIIKDYGSPRYIFHTPFKRGSDTIEGMVDAMEKKPREIIPDARLSRYFTGKEKIDPSVHTSTLKEKPPIEENWTEFQKRVKDFIKYLEDKDYFRSSKVIWVISHYLVMREIARYFQIPIKEKKMPFLYTFVIGEDEYENVASDDGIIKVREKEEKVEEKPVFKDLKTMMLYSESKTKKDLKTGKIEKGKDIKKGKDVKKPIDEKKKSRRYNDEDFYTRKIREMQNHPGMIKSDSKYEKIVYNPHILVPDISGKVRSSRRGEKDTRIEKEKDNEIKVNDNKEVINEIPKKKRDTKPLGGIMGDLLLSEEKRTVTGDNTYY